MDSYIEIAVLPDQEADANFLLNNLCAKLHAVLGQTTSGSVGVSFPEYAKRGRNLGNILRLHGTRDMLHALMQQPWLKGLRDYCHCSEIQAVPADARHCYFARRQQKSAHNKRQRSINKGWLSETEAVSRIADNADKELQLPYMQLTSRSSRQRMKVFVEQGPILTESVTGTFNAYGLSRLADGVTVPWF